MQALLLLLLLLLPLQRQIRCQHGLLQQVTWLSKPQLQAAQHQPRPPQKAAAEWCPCCHLLHTQQHLLVLLLVCLWSCLLLCQQTESCSCAVDHQCCGAPWKVACDAHLGCCHHQLLPHCHPQRCGKAGHCHGWTLP